MKDVELGWVAGILDGEGTVAFDRVGTWRKPRLSVTSTDYEIVTAIKKLIGGSVVERSDRDARWKPCWAWKLSGSHQVLSLLEKVLPYLRCPQKVLRAKYLLRGYHQHTPRNGYYTEAAKEAKRAFEEGFFRLGG